MVAIDRHRQRDPARSLEAPHAVAPQGRPRPQPDTVAQLLWLQQTAGNQAVARAVLDGDYDPLGQQGREEDEARQTSFDERDAEDAAFLRSFETRALELTNGLLDGSEERIQAERERYGIPQGAVNDEGLALAATSLADAIAVLTTLYGELGGYEQGEEGAVGAELEGEAFFEGEPHSAGGAARSPPRTPPAELYELVEGAERDYATLRAESTATYPVLAMYAPAHLGAGASSVARVAAAAPAERAAMLSVDLSGKLDDIAAVREALADGDLEIWTLPRIVGLTKQAMRVADGSREQEALEANIADVQGDELLQDLAIGAIGVALGLAAAMSLGAGAPLAAAGFSMLSAGLTALEIVDEVQDHLVAEAAAGTDLEKANAIAAGEPDLIWLAIAVLAGLADIHVAAAAFRSLRGLARGAVTAVGDRAALESADDALDELEPVGRLRSEGNDQLPGLGDELAAGAVREGAKAAAAGGRAGAAGVRVTARERMLEHLDMLGRRFRTWVRSGQLDRLDADMHNAERFADEIRAGKWPTAEMAQLPDDELDELADRYLQAVRNKVDQAQVESMKVAPTVAGGSSRKTDLRGGIILDVE